MLATFLLIQVTGETFQQNPNLNPNPKKKSARHHLVVTVATWLGKD